MKATNRQRTRCYTGCWTCRSRRVKCDETSPFCQRCRQFGVQCEGYGVRLNWIHYNSAASSSDETGHGGDDDEGDYDDNDRTQGSRRSMTYLGVSHVPRLSTPELDGTLRQVDEWCPGESSGLEQGGFSVFPVELAGRDLLGTEAVSPASSHRQDHSTMETMDHIEGLCSESTLTAASTPIQQPVSSDAVPVAQTLLSLGGERDHQPASTAVAVDAIQAPTHQQQNRHAPPRHLDILPMPANQKRLMHHWVTFTSRKLVLLDEPHNPCRTMMLPMALEGLKSSAEDSSAEVAIFHALCASAAFNLFELGGRTSERDHALALHHDQQAIRHLRHNLTRADEHRDQSFAMAIMACIAVEAISGTSQRWRTHVSGGLAYLAKLHARGVDEAVLSAFQRHMVSMAILCDFPVPDNLKAFLHDDDGNNDVENLEATFPYYGISRSFLRAHDHMNTIAGTTDKTPGASLDKELDALELQLYLNFPRLPPPSRDQGQTYEDAGLSNKPQVLHHMAQAFYYAGLVFLQRSIRHVPVDTVQSLVALGVRELETVERVGRGEKGCTMLWPVLVLAAECGTADLQRRMRAWFQDQRKLGFRNLVVLEELVDEVWSTRSGSGGGGSADGRNVVDWRDVIAQARFDVFRL